MQYSWPEIKNIKLYTLFGCHEFVNIIFTTYGRVRPLSFANPIDGELREINFPNFLPIHISTRAAVSSVVKRTRYRCGRSGVRLPGRSNRTQRRQRLASAATFLRSCVGQALNRADGPRHSLYAPA